MLFRSVAIVMQDTLGITPTSTRDTAENVDYTKGGAAFARLLRAVLALAGFDVKSIPRTQRGSGMKDLGPIIDAGLRLLRDPHLPRK